MNWENLEKEQLEKLEAIKRLFTAEQRYVLWEAFRHLYKNTDFYWWRQDDGKEILEAYKHLDQVFYINGTGTINDFDSALTDLLTKIPEE